MVACLLVEEILLFVIRLRPSGGGEIAVGRMFFFPLVKSFRLINLLAVYEGDKATAMPSAASAAPI